MNHEKKKRVHSPSPIWNREKLARSSSKVRRLIRTESQWNASVISTERNEMVSEGEKKNQHDLPEALNFF